jgi:hypothetical protein
MHFSRYGSGWPVEPAGIAFRMLGWSLVQYQIVHEIAGANIDFPCDKTLILLQAIAGRGLKNRHRA